MQINSQLLKTQSQNMDKPIELKQGEVYKAQIKERISDTEAVIQVRGKELTAKFEGKVPAENRVTVQVTGQRESGAFVKTIAVESGKTGLPQQAAEAKVLQSVGMTANDRPELKQAVQTLLDRGVPVTKESVAVLKSFFEKAPGTAEAKLDTVKALANKRLEVTQNHLRPIHEALHGKPLNQVLVDLAGEIDSEFNFGKSTKQEQLQMNQHKGGATPPQSVQINKVQIERGSQAGPSNQNQLIETVRKNRELIENQPDLKKVIAQVRKEVVNNSSINRDMAQKIEKAIGEAEKLQSIGKERLVQVLKDAEQQLAKQEQQLSSVRTIANTKQVQVESLPIREAKPSEIVAQVKATVAKSPNLQQSIDIVKTKLANHPNLPTEAHKAVERSVADSSKLLEQGRGTVGKELLLKNLNDIEKELSRVEKREIQQSQVVRREQTASETIKQIKDEVQREPNLQKAVEKVREAVVNNPRVDREVTQKVEKALTEVRQLQQMGREAAGRERLTQALTQVETELKQQKNQQPASETVKQLTEEVKREPNIQKAIERVQNALATIKNVDPEIAKNIERLAKQAGQLDQTGRERIANLLAQIEKTLGVTANDAQMETVETQLKPVTNADQKNQELKPQAAPLRQSEAIKQALTTIQKEPDLEKAMESVRKEVTSSSRLEPKAIEKINQTFNQASELLDKGRELGARQLITNTLTELQQELAKTEPQPLKQSVDTTQYDINEQLQAMNLQSKDILVTSVTQKLAQATHDFKELKRDISKNLDNVQRMIETFKNNALPQAKQMLDSAISKLDNAILKSEMMLLTDMKTEKQLMQASTQLAEARKLLAKGKHTEAAKIVQDVKALVDKLNFKPSDQKIMHYVSKESAALESKTPAQQFLNQFDETARSYVKQDASPRQMFEAVRSLGLNHDSELAKSLVFQKGDSGQQDASQQNQQQQNLKATLLKLAQTDTGETQSKVAQHAEQALNNLTGQQLLSKSDGGNLQSLFFSLPLLVGEQPENLQVFVNSQNEGEQVDWENCSLYFLLETKKLGDVGIMLSSTDRNLSITIKNDKPGFKERMEPIAAITKAKLDEIGYSVNSINFTRMTPMGEQAIETNQELVQQDVKPLRPVFTEKGMDYKI